MCDTMKNWYKRVRTHIDFMLLDLLDAIRDLRIAGKILVKTEPSPTTDSSRTSGMTPSQPARYFILEKVFSHIRMESQDSFIDVGCGKGRVLAYLKSIDSPCPLTGVELSEVPGKIAHEWTKKYNGIKVILGDAFLVDYNAYTILFLCQPFWPMTFIEFVHLIEKQLSHPIILIYVFDQSSGNYLEGRKGWVLQHRDEFYRIHGLQVAGGVRRYSIWKYNPNNDGSEENNSISVKPIPLCSK